MQANPVYDDAPREIRDYLAERVAACLAAGIAPARIAVDPGIGFGKNDGHNMALLRELAMLHELGVALLLGVSRKSFIGRLSRGEAPKDRLAGSLAAGLAGLDRGAQILRVHDVAETRQAIAVWQAPSPILTPIRGRIIATMTRKLFGTDGLRGTANREPITARTALELALAAGAQFRRGDHRHRVVIGKDTRLSGYMLEPALTAGFISMGMDVIILGPQPTPAVAMLTRSLRADLGVVISASHNPYQDNGIKLFGPDGYKLSDAVELAIEQKMTARNGTLAEPQELGRAMRLDDANGRYIEFVKNSFPKGLTLDGLKIVVDCAHGAAYRVAPAVLRELGADVVAIGVEPDGTNITRECGATAPAAMCKAVLAHGAHLGIALDGDADRLIWPMRRARSSTAIS
jgi:phosphoglucosamine mutase